MARGSKTDCEDKKKRYLAAKREYDTFRDDVLVYKASFDTRVEDLLSNDIPARKEKERLRDQKVAEIRTLLSGTDTAEAENAQSRITEINDRLNEINDRLNVIMGRLDGSAEPGEVPSLFAEGDALAQERQDLLTEHQYLSDVIRRYNQNVQEVQRLEGIVTTLEDEIEQMQQDIDAAETEAAADKNYFEEAQGHADHRKYLMAQIKSEWNDYECAVYGEELEDYQETPVLDDSDIPDEAESETDNGDYEVPEELEDPEDADEGEEWNPEEYEDLEDSGI